MEHETICLIGLISYFIINKILTHFKPIPEPKRHKSVIDSTIKDNENTEE